MRSFLFSCLILCSVLLAPAAQAATDSFRVRTLIGEDTTPPSIPSSLTAIPVATSQINISWDASTDDFEISGYQVFRDDVQIATTTVTSYNDTGLTASTTYTYYVTAFDWVGNTSASSSPVATTTFSSAPPPPVSESSTAQQGTRIRLTLLSLEILPDKDALTIRYETEQNIRSVIQWGRTISYELGSLVEGSFGRMHETRIVGLTPGTLYKFSITGEHGTGITHVLTERTFMTLSEEDVFPPGNVGNLTAVRDGKDVFLTWDNPKDSDLAKVRVVRSDRFYPSDPQDGWVVFDSLGDGAHDRDIAVPGARLYYTVFSYDVLGNISSGAVTFIAFSDGGEAVLPPPEPIRKNPLELSLHDLRFIQDEELLPVREGTIHIDGGKRLTIDLPYERVPEHLKTILVTLTDSREADKEFSFLLRINRERTAYTATLAPLGVSGDFPIRVSVFDYETAQIGYAEGTINSAIAFVVPSDDDGGELVSVARTLIAHGSGGYLIFFVLLLIVLALSARRLAAARW